MELKFILEALLFTSQEPLNSREFRDLLKYAAEFAEEAKPYRKASDEEVTKALEQLAADHEQAGRSYRLMCVAGSWQFYTQPEYMPWVRSLVGEKTRPTRLSQPAMETLAIVAYRQPITRAEIEQVRGVSVDGVIQTLLERGLVVAVGRAEVVGRPVTFGTTEAFLEYFGLRGLDDLPAADELRRIPILKPEALLTADAGLATAPPQQLQMGQIAPEPPPEAAVPSGETPAASTPAPAEPAAPAPADASAAPPIEPAPVAGSPEATPASESAPGEAPAEPAKARKPRRRRAADPAAAAAPVEAPVESPGEPSAAHPAETPPAGAGESDIPAAS